MTAEITDGVKVSAESIYESQYSDPANRHFVFAYKIIIQNLSDYRIQLLSRQWQIFDSSGMRRIVEGEGVVGLQPIIEPGDCHEYVSACNLSTDIGSMVGFYEMKRIVDDEHFRVSIPKFYLMATFRLN